MAEGKNYRERSHTGGAHTVRCIPVPYTIYSGVPGNKQDNTPPGMIFPADFRQTKESGTRKHSQDGGLISSISLIYFCWRFGRRFHPLRPRCQESFTINTTGKTIPYSNQVVCRQKCGCSSEGVTPVWTFDQSKGCVCYRSNHVLYHTVLEKQRTVL